jgi:tetratricopeptide (TPR) repeat protein
LAKTTPAKLVSPLLFKKVEVPSQLQTAHQALEDTDYKKAESILVPYLVKHTRDTAAYMMLGRAALGQENWTEAMEIFNQVLALNNKEKDVYALLGYAAYRCGKRTRALEALQRAQEIDPTNEEVLKHLLLIAHQMDNAALEHSIEEKLHNLHAQAKV